MGRLLDHNVYRIETFTLTDQGRKLAARLPWKSSHGNLKEVISKSWANLDGLVVFASIGATVRIISPLLQDKESDPCVVCVDEASRFAVVVLGGHANRLSGNALAHEVAGYLELTPITTTASELVNSHPGQSSQDFHLLRVHSGRNLARLKRTIIDGLIVSVDNHIDWEFPESPHEIARRVLLDVDFQVEPPALVEHQVEKHELANSFRECVVHVTDHHIDESVVVNPPSLILGVGCSSDCPEDEIVDLVDKTFEKLGLAKSSICEVATIDSRADHRAVTRFGVPIRSFRGAELDMVTVPNPSSVVEGYVGTKSVAEAAALMCLAGTARRVQEPIDSNQSVGSGLLVEKQKGPHCTFCVARRTRPQGVLHLVGLGPGRSAFRTVQCVTTIQNSDVIVGYGPYVDQCQDLITLSQVTFRLPIGAEYERARLALELAQAGYSVSLVCSGDPGVFAMAPMALELLEQDLAFERRNFDVELVPGVTAANAVSGLLGAPLGHDHAIISLSDLTTDWDTICNRIEAVASTDMVIALYNPRSETRTWQLPKALDIISRYRAPSTPIGIVTNAMRDGQIVLVTTLAEIDVECVTMNTCLIVGNSTTRTFSDFVFTPRGRSIRTTSRYQGGQDNP